MAITGQPNCWNMFISTSPISVIEDGIGVNKLGIGKFWWQAANTKSAARQRNVICLLRLAKLTTAKVSSIAATHFFSQRDHVMRFLATACQNGDANIKP